MQDRVDLNLRVPLEKEIPVTVVPEEKEDAKSADGEEEFPEITEVSPRSKSNHDFLPSVHRNRELFPLACTFCSKFIL